MVYLVKFIFLLDNLVFQLHDNVFLENLIKKIVLENIVS